ncbi:invasion associated locus B family protein [Amylibacter sp.]|nr:invasion associated locus B family protein [Amylibacter sp.]
MKFLTFTFLVINLAISSPLFAQSKDEEFPVEAQKTEDTGPYIRETHGSWEVRCVKLTDAETCTLYQLLKDKNDISVAEINIEILPVGNQASAGITLITPLGTSLEAQLGWHIDDQKVRQYPYGWCEQSGCIARFGLTEEDVVSMKKGANGKVYVVSIATPNEPFELNLSLKGFTAAWNSVPQPTQ